VESIKWDEFRVQDNCQRLVTREPAHVKSVFFATWMTFVRVWLGFWRGILLKRWTSLRSPFPLL
jgi:hypothetical protein